MKNKNFIKAIGIAVTAIGFGVSILTDWVNEKKMDEKIEEKVNEALAKKMMKTKRSPNKGSFFLVWSKC
ncbi:MAG: hypothetical protein ACLR7L_17740 [Enterocloster sp.]